MGGKFSFESITGLWSNSCMEDDDKNIKNKHGSYLVGLGDLRVTCSPRDPRFSGSNPAEVDGFFQDVKILSTSLPGGTLCWES